MDLSALKVDNFEQATLLSVPVFDNSDNLIAKLIPIGEWALEDSSLIQKFTRWRKVYMRFFLSQFEATEQRTKSYLEDQVIMQDDRVLFAIYANDTLTGHIGICNITDSSAELDNMIRGASGSNVDLMFYVERSCLQWAYKHLGVDTILARVISNNFLAKLLHERFGFILEKSTPLLKKMDKNTVTYEPCLDKYATEPFFLETMSLSRFRFSSK